MAKTTPKRESILSQLVSDLGAVLTTERNVKIFEQTAEFPILYLFPSFEDFEFGTGGQLESTLTIELLGYVKNAESDRDIFNDLQSKQVEVYQKLNDNYRISEYAELTDIRKGEYYIFNPYGEFTLTMDIKICRS